MGLLDSLWHDAEHDAGSVISGGAHLIGDGLNAVGLSGAARWVDTKGTEAGFALGADVPELQLGETSDPVELVHGDPAAISSAASRLRAFSAAFAETAAGLAGLDAAHWTGAAADAFRAKYAPQPARWRDAATAAEQAAGALETYADAVRSAQGQARHAIDLYAEGQRASAAAAAAYNQQVAAYNAAARQYDGQLAAGQDPGTRPAQPGPFADPGEALRQEAQQVLSTARSARNAAAAAAAAEITAATALAPPEPGFWSQMGDDLSDTLQAGSLASVSLGGGIVEGAVGIVKFARSVDPMDPWNQEHPAEYLAGLSGTAAGLADAEVNPGVAVKGLLGSGWDSDPFQALGGLLPNVALAVATDGTGSAADAADAADAAEEASQATQDMTLAGDPVNVATGEVVLAQADVTLPGVLPLVVERAHRSSWLTGRWFGRSWTSSFDQRLVVMGGRVIGIFADGRILTWPRPGGDAPALPVAGPAWPLRGNDDGSYTVTDPRRGLAWRFERRPGYWAAADGAELPLVSAGDRAGHLVTFGYDEAGRPASVTHSGGYQLQVTVSGGRVTGLDLGGDVPLVRYAYDGDGNLAGVVNSSGQPLRFAYDPAGWLAGWRDRNDRFYRYEYDDQGRCVRGDGPDGTFSGVFSYEAGTTRWTDADGAVTAYQIDESARVTAITDPLGNVTRWEHDERGRVTAHADPLGRITRYAYGARGNLAAVTRPDGSQASAVYDDRGLPVRLTEPGGGAWAHEYDAHGNRTRLTAPDGSVTLFGYDGDGHLASVTDAAGAVTRVVCDAAGLPLSVTGPDAGRTSYIRDQFGRVVQVTGADGGTTYLTWTAEGRLASRTLPDDSAEHWAYDAEGNPIRHLSRAGGLTAYQYGPFDMLTAVTRPDGTRSEFGYDHELRLTGVRHAGLTWRYEYDAAGRLVTETDYNGAATRYAYDPAGQLVRQVNACGQETGFAYDQLGNLTGRSADGAVTAFGYDAAGRLVHARNPDAEIRFDRDMLGRVTAETCDGRTTRSEYDAVGRVIRRVTPSGAATAWEYDQAGNPVLMTADGHRIGFGYDPGGRETRRELPGGLTLTQDWDPLGQLTVQAITGQTAAGRPLQRRAYTYRTDGFVESIDDLLTGHRGFDLDDAGRVTAVTGPGWSERYAYDRAGNLTAATWPAPPPGPATAWLDADLRGERQVTGTLITRAGNIRYHHDRAGRVVTRQRVRISRKPDTWRYEWDADNRLTAVTTPDGSTWRYRYDPFGRRIAKQHYTPDGRLRAQTDFTWDGPVLAEQAATTGQPDHQQVVTWNYRPGTFAPLTQAEHTSLRDAPQQQIDQRFYAIITDLVGTPSELASPDGTLAGYQQHTLWGTTIWHPGGAQSPLRFPGQYEDPETGLHYNHHRYYDPVSATYLTPDPLGLAPAPNPHTYVPNPTCKPTP